MNINIQHKSGMIAELFVATELAKKDYTILWPQGTQTRYDFAIENNGKFSRVQVKKASWSTTNQFKYLQARISTRNKNCSPKYSEGEFEDRLEERYGGTECDSTCR